MIIDFGMGNFSYEELNGYTESYMGELGDLYEFMNGPPCFNDKEDRIKAELKTIGNTLFSIACYGFKEEIINKKFYFNYELNKD